MDEDPRRGSDLAGWAAMLVCGRRIACRCDRPFEPGPVPGRRQLEDYLAERRPIG